MAMRMLRVLRATGAPVLRTPAVRVGFAALPVLSLGLLCPVPSLVLALRRRTRADWLAFAGFTAVLAAWITEVALTPVDTHGVLFGVDLLLITLSMAGASAHAWTAWPRRAGQRERRWPWRWRWRWLGAQAGVGAGAGVPAGERAEALAVEPAGEWAEALAVERPEVPMVERPEAPVVERAKDVVVERAEE
ncbi:hypothetical protein [Streptomyces sp. N50]|uniref:hypothetical protein n=1 Tax=Streptomyces sp. N50 TaxID=3081765 RepID=UPI0029620D82|nr:hypothetical protein [Streptomyces sp. N50]WOX10197.1 hypothetical protein R2B38_15645 [Streptomyces sp. N50]